MASSSNLPSVRTRVSPARGPRLTSPRVITGALSDRSTSQYRRRFFIVLSALLVIVSTLVVAYAHALASILASLSGLGDWDPESREQTKQHAIFLAVVGFYVLDFSLNGLQASLRVRPGEFGV